MKKAADNSRGPWPTGMFAVWCLFAFSMCAYVVLAWPGLYSFIAFGFRDAGSFIWLEHLWRQNLRLGVDIGYNYGLLGVFAQHLAGKIVGGPGYRVFIGLGIAYLLVMAMLWAMLWRRLARLPEFLIALVLLTPWMAIYFPVPPYALVQIALMAGLLCLLRGRCSWSLALAVAGWLAVPSLPIIFAGLVAGKMLIDWLRRLPRSLSHLLSELLPASVVGLILATMLIAEYGWASFWATVLPASGAAMYKALNYGILGVGWSYIHPAGAGLGYYLGTGVGWWMFGVLSLGSFAAAALFTSFRERHITNVDSLILFSFALEVAFIAFAFGSGFHTMYYNPVMIAGFLAGASKLSAPLLRRTLLAAFVVLGLLGRTASFRAEWRAWKTAERSASTAFLFVPDGFRQEWDPILRAAGSSRVLILSYGNGAREFLPAIDMADSWFLLPGLLKPAEKQGLLNRIRGAEVVAEELRENTSFIDRDPEIQSALKRFDVVGEGHWFRVFRRSGTPVAPR